MIQKFVLKNLKANGVTYSLSFNSDTRTGEVRAGKRISENPRVTITSGVFKVAKDLTVSQLFDAFDHAAKQILFRARQFDEADLRQSERRIQI